MFSKEEINARLKKSLQGKVPKLKCLITGIERSTSMDYLKTKEDKFGSIDNFVKNYISSDAVKLLKEGKDITNIRNQLNSDVNFNPNIAFITEAKKYYGL